MKNMEVMNSIQNEKIKEIASENIPAIDAEATEVMKAKRIAIDQPNTEVKFDPLR